MVKELSRQLEQANAAASAARGPSGVNSAESSRHDGGKDDQTDALPNKNAGNVQEQFGRLVLHDANHSRYVSSGFWSRINDEVRPLHISRRSS
jgi:hypothetical protein